MTGVKLEKISVINNYLFIEKGLREGISYVANNIYYIFAKANSKYINDYDPKVSSTFLSYLDIIYIYTHSLPNHIN